MTFTFDPSLIYWDVYPQHKVLLADLYASGTELKTSKIAWAIAQVVHPDSDFWGMSIADKKLLVATDYLSDPKFDWALHQESVDKFGLTILTRKERTLNIWADKIDERDELLKEVPYTLDTLEFLDKALVVSTKIQQGYDKALSEYEKSNSSGQAQGGAEESFMEKRMN
jgi:hypothetical protein|tara:strand:+ start:211 stop:717 length:507 start_codon:yes stop_codon:yes gene_type:complete